jgi:hypothetical protein
MKTLLDRARDNTLASIEETHCIISAMEGGILINWSLEELDRLKGTLIEHESLIQLYTL